LQAEISIYHHLIESDTSSKNTQWFLNNIGNAYLKQGKLSQALQSYKKGLKLEEEYSLEISENLAAC